MKSEIEEQGNIGTESDCHTSSGQILSFFVLILKAAEKRVTSLGSDLTKP